MSYQVLARKYRPQRFSEVIGQEHVTRTLRNAIEQGRTAHGYIFSGHRGIGKTTVARILAMALNCRSADRPVSEPCGSCESCTEVRAGNAVDVIEIDAATNRGIDEIRELREAARYRPARDRFKIYILDEAHQITDAAFNALLKTLEEPPPHVVFMLATTQPEDIPQTIRSRCQHFSFRAVRFEEIVAQLRELCGREGISADEEALALLAEAGDGSMRDALSVLDQAIASSEGRLGAESVRQLVGVVSSAVLEALMQAVSRAATRETLEIADRLLAEGHNPVHLARQLLRFLRNALVAKVAGADSSVLQVSADERNRVARVAGSFSEEELTRHLQIMLRAHAEIGYRQEQRFHLELALMKLAHAQKLLPIEQLLSAVEGGTAPEHAVSSHPEAKKGEGPGIAQVSPFAADSARKAASRKESALEVSSPPWPSAGASATPQVVMGSVAPAVARNAVPAQKENPEETELVRSRVLSALETSGVALLLSTLESGEWRIEASELIIRLPASPAFIEMSLTNEARRTIVASASGTLGRPVQLQVVAGISPRPAPPDSPAARESSRGRAEREPVVRRIKEKFGAEIRTVIDYKGKP
ncbi:MAG: DNA polymerase III subunit gamma/tau [Acidobacteria bacterium]|nr:DNA polymerase III subunit gamma/tau [Acidobacteriota bacterium]